MRKSNTTECINFVTREKYHSQTQAAFNLASITIRVMTDKPHFIKLKKVESTNSYAASLLKSEQVKEATVVWSQEQTSGKGQGDNRWESEPGKNLTFSWILFPHFLPPDRQFLLNKMISLGVSDFLIKLQIPLPVSIKWPNDIYLENKKVGGILINNTICGDRLATAVVGIGLNVNQMHFSNDTPNAVSVRQVTGNKTDLKSGLRELVNNLNLRYAQLRSGAYESLETDYLDRLLGYQQWRTFRAKNHEFEGKVQGVDEYGRLIVLTRKNESALFDHGKIEFLFKSHVIS